MNSTETLVRVKVIFLAAVLISTIGACITLVLLDKQTPSVSPVTNPHRTIENGTKVGPVTNPHKINLT